MLASLRKIWVSVVIFVGMRFSRRSFSGRMSWCIARNSVMTKMFSLSRAAVAGRKIWVSVVIFVGMRFSRRSFSGRMSWCIARNSVMTKMFSLSRAAVAGSESGMRMGMVKSFRNVVQCIL